MPKLVLIGLIVLVSFLSVSYSCLGADSFALYQVGTKEVQSWSLARDFFKEKGYDVVYQLGEPTIEKHMEKMSKINRSPAKFLVAMELVRGSDSGVMIAMTDRTAEGTSGERNATPFAPDVQTGNRFLAIDQLQAKYVSDSGRLADALSSAFQVKVKHMPLFPLLGADMPGIFLRIECKQEKVGEMLGLLHGGIQKYLRRDVSHER